MRLGSPPQVEPSWYRIKPSLGWRAVRSLIWMIPLVLVGFAFLYYQNSIGMVWTGILITILGLYSSIFLLDAYLLTIDFNPMTKTFRRTRWLRKPKLLFQISETTGPILWEISKYGRSRSDWFLCMIFPQAKHKPTRLRPQARQWLGTHASREQLEQTRQWLISQAGGTAVDKVW